MCAGIGPRDGAKAVKELAIEGWAGALAGCTRAILGAVPE
jgi:hypothetical protein